MASSGSGFWSLYRNIQLMPGFLQALFLVLHFSYYYILLTFLMLLAVILLLSTLLSTLSVIKHLICGNKLASELKSNLWGTVDWDRKCFLVGVHSMQGLPDTTKNGVTRKRSSKRLKHTGNLFRKNLQLNDVC